MFKKFFLFSVFFITQFYLNPVFAHVLHYQNLNRLEFDLYRNNELIGQHIYLFDRKGYNLTVHNKINFKIKVFGVIVYRYSSEGYEKYVNGKFKSFSATTNHNKKEKFCKIYKKENQFFIEGSSYKGNAPEDFIIGTWWNHEIIKYGAQISVGSGRIIEQTVRFIGKETIEINNETYTALKFNFFSSDPSLSKDKKLNTNVWYDDKTLMWLKTSFEKTGYWEYRLKYFD